MVSPAPPVEGPPLPRAEYIARQTRVEAAKVRAGLDALVAYSVGNQSGPAAYLAGYEPRFGQKDVSICLLVPGRSAALIAYAYWDEPATRTWIDDVVVMPDLTSIGRLVAERVPAAAARIGIAGSLFFPHTLVSALQSARPRAVLEDATPLLLDLARVKTATEIMLLREGARQTDAGLAAFLDGAREGKEERALALDVERAMVMAGAERSAFPVLLFSGRAVETGIGFPAARRLSAGDQVNVVCGALHRGYKMDLGRVTTVGSPPAGLRDVMDTAAEMHAAMLGVVRQGVPAEAVARAGMEVVRDRRMDAWVYPHGPAGYAGHGIGCWLDEPPRLRLGETAPLEDGMVLVLEARLGRAGAGGAAITDPVLVGPVGAERLSRVPIHTWD